MKLYKIVATTLIIGLFSSTSVAQAQKNPDISLFKSGWHYGNHDTLPYLIYTSKLAKTDSSKPALVVFLHGAGERGKDNRKQLKWCVQYFINDTVSLKHSFILLIPQCPENQRWVNTDWTLPSHKMEQKPTAQMHAVKWIIDSFKTSQHIDSNRIYICGISMGGFGVWDALQRYPNYFAAAIAICGGGDPSYAKNIKDTPLYIFHGSKDKLVKPQRSKQMYVALKHIKSKDLHYVVYLKHGHLCWDAAFATPGIFDWLFSKKNN